VALPDLGVSTSQDRFVALAEFRFRPDRVVGLRRDPARLGRRVLLERAAYRLLTCDRSVLGWRSRRGTPAMRRSPGRDPARRPERGALPAGQSVAARRAKVTAMGLLTRMVEYHIWLAGEMIGRARRLPRTG